jgi:hypothetical protein
MKVWSEHLQKKAPKKVRIPITSNVFHRVSAAQMRSFRRKLITRKKVEQL